jgi:hypothetical protein
VTLGLAVAAALQLGLQDVVPLPLMEPVTEPPNEAVQGATLQVRLAQQGAFTADYNGNGAPSVALTITANESVADWSFNAWATPLTPAVYDGCTNATIHYDVYDWTFYAQTGTTGSTEGEYVSTPSTVPGRLGPAGDQCPLRAGATGPWSVLTCIEGKAGGPTGLHEAGSVLVVDDWDRCLDVIVVVP